MDDPRLAADLGHRPARLDRHEAERAAERHQAQVPGHVGQGPAANVQPAAEERGRGHREPAGDHQLEGEVDDRDRRAVGGRERVEALHERVRVVEGEEAQAVRDAQRPDAQRRARLGLEVALHRRELGGLGARDLTGAHVAAERLEERGRAADAQRDRDRAPVEEVPRVLAQPVGVDGRDREADGGEGGQRHVQRLAEGRGIAHRGDGIDVHRPPRHEVEAGRRVHPGVGDDDEDPRRGAADGDHHPREPVRPRRHAVPAVEVDAQEDRLQEEREALDGERHPEDRAGERHEARPQQAQLEREHRAGDRSHREQDRRSPGPPVGEGERRLVLPPEPERLRDGHEHGHADADRREHDVEGERHRHLGTRGEKVAHAPILSS